MHTETKIWKISIKSQRTQSGTYSRKCPHGHKRLLPLLTLYTIQTLDSLAHPCFPFRFFHRQARHDSTRGGAYRRVCMRLRSIAVGIIRLFGFGRGNSGIGVGGSYFPFLGLLRGFRSPPEGHGCEHPFFFIRGRIEQEDVGGFVIFGGTLWAYVQLLSRPACFFLNITLFGRRRTRTRNSLQPRLTENAPARLEIDERLNTVHLFHRQRTGELGAFSWFSCFLGDWCGIECQGQGLDIL